MSRVAHPAGPRHADVLPAEHPPAPPADLNALDPAIWPRSARRADGILNLGGIDVRDLAGQHGTPVFVLDEEDFRGRCREFARLAYLTEERDARTDGRPAGDRNAAENGGAGRSPRVLVRVTTGVEAHT